VTLPGPSDSELSGAPGAATASGVDRGRLRSLLGRERRRFHEEHPRSGELFRRGRRCLLAGVPMSWMGRWAGGFPIYLEGARGSHVVDVDGREYADFCMGDTGAMAGHSPGATVTAVGRRFREHGGAATMLPTEDGAAAAELLAERFGLPYWQFTLSATDANRFVLRLAREVTGRPRVLVFNYCYHGTVDETLATIAGGETRARDGNVGPPVDPSLTTRVVEFNDLDALERALEQRDVACVLAEPALTNIGIVLPDDGFHARLRELTRATGTLLVIDETHTFSAGPGGCTAAWGLEPDAVTIGKSLGGGVPVGAYGVTAELGDGIAARADADYEDVGGIGGTLAGNVLSLAATRATLEEVLTEPAFERMSHLCERLVAGMEAAIREGGMPWSVVRLGARAEYRYTPEPPRSGGESASAGDDQLDEYMHLYTLNRGILMTPFHNMALVSPDTTEDQVDRHVEVFAAAVGELGG
jgi:glutamate-1-semialdehyde 2,1-aminomutase